MSAIWGRRSCSAALGAAASAPVVLIFVFDNLLLFSLVPLLMSVAGVEKLEPVGATIRRIVWRILTHPFNVATALGIAASYLHLRLPQAADQMVTWLSGAAAPCALFILGVTVAMRPLWRIPAGCRRWSLIKLVAASASDLGVAVGARAISGRSGPMRPSPWRPCRRP